MSAPARLMRGTRCELVVLERSSELTVQLGRRLLAVQVRDLDADPARGTIGMDLAGIDPGRERRPALGDRRTAPEITPGRGPEIGRITPMTDMPLSISEQCGTHEMITEAPGPAAGDRPHGSCP
jgi:hypothetical protein